MIRGLYTAASGMQSLQRQQESLSNNLANINTPGYKQDDAVMRSFPEQLISRIRDSQSPDIQGWPSIPSQPAVIGGLHTGVYVPEAISNFAQGDIEQTYSAFDVALTDNLPIDPDGPVVNGKPVQPRLFFGVARLQDDAQLDQPVDPANIRYTRNGSWQVNDQGYLVTAEGYHVLDQQNRAIRVNGLQDLVGGTIDVGEDLKILPDGQLLRPDPFEPEGTYVPLTEPLNNEPGPRIGIKVVDDPYQLVREGNSVYRWEGEEVPADVSEDPALEGFYAVRQGWIERANVDSARTMTDMMTVLRAYEANQRVITTLDGTLEKAANEIGRVNG
ncbi:flagellar hook-basal body protein [Brevibacillus humidisoli]|uniref:flagellar hook-basal body protein n=1 Tax=Brevibacillus humidisoli TaxID=2895522 RepID=UPI001E4C0D88|nr:flagellar hook-basal body protein [Brevibacillus humidisoli]UFJ40140.1 flagellar hook-basal body protein [Brevibacillus humidisoli]